MPRKDKPHPQWNPNALESYYDRLATSTSRELMEHFRSARLGLLAGLALFGMFMGTRALLKATVPAMPTAVDEGLIILAWLTLWRPAETLAYEWRPLYRRCINDFGPYASVCNWSDRSQPAPKS